MTRLWVEIEHSSSEEQDTPIIVQLIQTAQSIDILI